MELYTIFNKEKHRQALLQIIKATINKPIEVWAYGSRVSGLGHEGSDLDLVIKRIDEQPLDRKAMFRFKEAVQDSNIPYLIDARDWYTMPVAFKKSIVENHVVVFPEQNHLHH